jgi:hypothetical protein
MKWLQQLLPVARYLLRIDAECGDHFVQADFTVPIRYFASEIDGPASALDRRWEQ